MLSRIEIEVGLLEDLLLAARASVEGWRRQLARQPGARPRLEAALRERCDLLLDASYALVVRDVPAEGVAERLATAARAASGAERVSADRALHHALVRCRDEAMIGPALRALVERYLLRLDERAAPPPSAIAAPPPALARADSRRPPPKACR